MLNGLNPIDSMLSNGVTNPTSSLFGSPVNFASTFDQAMAQAKTPADQAKVLVEQAKLSEQNALASLFSDSSSSVLGFGTTDLFGIGGNMGLPSWAYDVQRLLGNNSAVAQVMSTSQQAALMNQSILNNQLSSLGSTGSGVNSLF